MDEQIIIPEGWTYFSHRTNTSNWSDNPFDANTITVKKIMSVVTEFDIKQEKAHYGDNYRDGYSMGKGEPFEIRCLICNMKHLRELDDSEIKEVMMKEFYYDKRNFGGCYGQRHHSIPPKEELIVLGIGNHDETFDREARIIWTIPKRFTKFYSEELQKGNTRVIDINVELEEPYQKS